MSNISNIESKLAKIRIEDLLNRTGVYSCIIDENFAVIYISDSLRDLLQLDGIDFIRHEIILKNITTFKECFEGQMSSGHIFIDDLGSHESQFSNKVKLLKLTEETCYLEFVPNTINTHLTDELSATLNELHEVSYQSDLFLSNTLEKILEIGCRLAKSQSGIIYKKALKNWQALNWKLAEDKSIDDINSRTKPLNDKSLNIGRGGFGIQKQKINDKVWQLGVPVYQNNEVVCVMLFLDTTLSEAEFQRKVIVFELLSKWVTKIFLEQNFDMSLLQAYSRVTQNEHKRFASELHDNVGPLISAAGLIWESLNLAKPEDKEKIKEGIQHLQEANKRIRSVTHYLLPTPIIDFGLEIYLNKKLESMAVQSNVKIETHIVGPFTDLQEYFELSIANILLELVENAIVHGYSKFINVQVIGFDNHINIQVEDNGVGIEKSLKELVSLNLGLGMIYIKIKSMGGSVEFDSRKGKGTTVSIEIPLYE